MPDETRAANVGNIDPSMESNVHGQERNARSELINKSATDGNHGTALNWNILHQLQKLEDDTDITSASNFHVAQTWESINLYLGCLPCLSQAQLLSLVLRHR